MDGNRRYLRCKREGEGVFSDHPVGSMNKFKIIDISAAGIRISTKRSLEERDTVEMSIIFSGYLHEKHIDVKSRVVRKEKKENGFEYGLEFVDLTHKEKVEIDEIMKQSCSINHEKTLSNCDYGDCVFLK